MTESWSEVRPHRSVIGRVFSITHFAIDPGGDAFFRQRFACQNSVYPQSTIFFKGAHLIIPPAEKFSFLVVNSKRVEQAEAAQIPKSGAFALGSHDGALPKLGVVNIDVFRSDIEIATHDQVVKFFLRNAVSDPPIPLQFILIRRRADGLSIGSVN